MSLAQKRLHRRLAANAAALRARKGAIAVQFGDAVIHLLAVPDLEVDAGDPSLVCAAVEAPLSPAIDLAAERSRARPRGAA